MADWKYSPDEWERTRTVTLAQDGDGLWRWRRNRTGPAGREVAQSVSGGFDDAKWAYRNAVKENVGLIVDPPEGVEPLNVIVTGGSTAVTDDSDEDQGHEDEGHVEVPPQPEVEA